MRITPYEPVATTQRAVISDSAQEYPRWTAPDPWTLAGSSIDLLAKMTCLNQSAGVCFSRCFLSLKVRGKFHM